MIIQPTDLPVVRRQLLDWYADGRAATHFTHVYPTGWPVESRLNDSPKLASMADLYFVSPEMASLAVEAAKTLPDYRVQPDDIPCRNGFLYSPQPLWQQEIPTDGVAGASSIVESIVGAMWAVAPQATKPRPHGMVWFTWLVSREAYLAQVACDPAEHAAARQALPPIYETHVPMVWPFSQGEGVRDRDEVASRGAILKTIWTLMQQPIARLDDVEFKRYDRRKLERQQIDPSRVRVITLRRAKTTGDHGDSDREYYHQWIVRGHWRQQYYPSRDVHRPVWIAPHIKGPEGAPMLGGEKVHAWVR